MNTMAFLAQLQNTPRDQREPLYQQIERDHGKGFAASLRDMIDSDEMIRANFEAAKH